MLPVVRSIIRRQEALILALMLELLHFSIWLDFGNPLSRSLILIHLGLFLIWQPVWRHDEQLSWFNSLVFILLTLSFVTFMNWALLFAWLILLSGFAGGRIIINRQERTTYMVVLVFLTSELIIQATPNLFDIQTSTNITRLFGILLPFLPLLLAVLPARPADTRIQSVDLQHALVTSTLMTLLIFGSLLNMYLSTADYMVSLVQSLIAIALFLFGISWLISPRAGFSGLSQLWSRALLNIGTPFERWLEELANISLQQQTPDAFLEMAMEELVSLPWINGVAWSAGKRNGEYGKLSRHAIEFNTDHLQISLYTYNPAGAALYHHCNLLVQLIDHFYVAKVRERKLTQQAQIQAVHETGARVTHDIKNLLQSLQAITSLMSEEHDAGSTGKARTLFREQMPHLTRRMQLALDKLNKPGQIPMESRHASDWWQSLTGRHTDPHYEFNAEITDDRLIPAELFDSVTENLLENLKGKMQHEGELQIKISLCSDPEQIQLQISDNGSAIPPEKAEIILREPMQSANGLGIGLYQAARQAESMGYRLELSGNQEGAVTFSLRGTKA
jgi:signal transduction histidine kinase